MGTIRQGGKLQTAINNIVKVGRTARGTSPDTPPRSGPGRASWPARGSSAVTAQGAAARPGDSLRALTSRESAQPSSLKSRRLSLHT